MKQQRHLVILGAGHAGSSAALAAANRLNQLQKTDDVTITIVNPSPCLTIRPRLYEYELESTQVSLQSFLEPIGVNVVVSHVQQVEFMNQRILLGHQQHLHYDALIVALGSQLTRPNIPGIELVYNIDSFASAKKFRDDLIDSPTQKNHTPKIAILGGGITGIELATELPITFKKMAREYNTSFAAPIVYLIDRHESAKNVGVEAAESIQEALNMAGVRCINHASVDRVDKNKVIYNKREVLEADFIVSTLGLRANNLTKQFSQVLDSLGRVHVNQYLQTQENENCFCAGDAAHAKPAIDRDPMMSCQQGRPQGRFAGYNAISYLLDQPMRAYSQPNYVTCIDLGEFGAIYTEGWERKLVKSGMEAKKIKQHINQERIYPPKTTNKAELFAAGALDFIPPTVSISQE